jgi:hypothetical protein
MCDPYLCAHSLGMRRCIVCFIWHVAKFAQCAQGGKHLGLGAFEVKTDDYTILFEGGHAMQRLPCGQGWTPVHMERGSFPYDIEDARRILQWWMTEIGTQDSEPATQLVSSFLAEPESNSCRSAQAGAVAAARPESTLPTE